MHDLAKPRKVPYTEATQDYSDTDPDHGMSLAKARWCCGEPMKRDVYSTAGIVKFRCYTCKRAVQRQLRDHEL